MRVLSFSEGTLAERVVVLEAFSVADDTQKIFPSTFRLLRQRAFPSFEIQLLNQCASGSGRSWKCKTLLVVPLPPSA